MPTWRPTTSRCSGGSSGFFSATAARPRSIASSITSMNRTGSPLRLLSSLRSSPSTTPKETCSARVGGTSHPAIAATAKTMAKC